LREVGNGKLQHAAIDAPRVAELFRRRDKGGRLEGTVIGID